VYGAGHAVKDAAGKLSQATGLVISIVPPCSHADMLRLMARARIDLAVNTGDGTPNTMLEAMMMGAFPIQSDTESAKEWITPGANGLLVHPQRAETVTQALRELLKNTELVEQAAMQNEQLTRTRIEASVLLPQIRAMYEKVHAES
jgi:glycosyltransferase involved in cell wall biosynthesis